MANSGQTHHANCQHAACVERRAFEAAMERDGWTPIRDRRHRTRAWYRPGAFDITQEYALDHWNKTNSTPPPF